jgi:hypothetical protein
MLKAEIERLDEHSMGGQLDIGPKTLIRARHDMDMASRSALLRPLALRTSRYPHA